MVETLSDLVIKIERLDGKKKRIVHRNQVKKVENAQKYLDQQEERDNIPVHQQNINEAPIYSLTSDENGLPAMMRQ